MKFKTYIRDNSYEYIEELISVGTLNEMSSDTFKTIKKAGNKLGLRINKSLTIWDFLKKSNDKFFELYNLASLYLLTDITDNKSRKGIIKDAKKVIKGLNKRELMSFIFQLDKASFGLTAHIRHIIQSIFGVEITTYNNWIESKTYLEHEVNRMIEVLGGMGEYPKETKQLKDFKKSIKEL